MSAGKILVVDDDHATCDFIVRTLEQEDYITAVANSGAEAVEKARILMPDAITLDVLMPSGNGFEALVEIKKRPDTRSIPIVLVSVLDHQELGFALGAVDYLLKPLEKSALRESLRHADMGKFAKGLAKAIREQKVRLEGR